MAGLRIEPDGLVEVGEGLVKLVRLYIGTTSVMYPILYLGLSWIAWS